MPHPDEPALVAYVAAHTSQTALAVYDAPDPGAAHAALRAAAARISEIRHPEEPDCALPNWCDVLDEDGVPVLHLDMKDEVAYAALVVRLILDELAGAGVDGRLAPRQEPEEPVSRDPAAARYTRMDDLTELDGRGLPPGFPDGFPVPDEATLVLAQRWRDGAAEHAAWRRSVGPFTGYLARLREFGCAFGAVPRLLTIGPGGPDVAYTLERHGAGGSVALYRSGPDRLEVTEYWYVSVVWCPQVPPPGSPVEPDEAPDDRPPPAGAAAARELAEFLVPPEFVLGYETVVALRTAASALDRLVKSPPDPADRRPRPVVIAGRFAQVLGRLDERQLAVLRHVSLTMAGNVIDSGQHARPAGLTLVPDEDGHLYAADLREYAQPLMHPALLTMFEAGAAVTMGAPIAAGPVGDIRSAPARPPVHRYLWLLAGLDDAQLTTARDACWGMFQP